MKAELSINLILKKKNKDNFEKKNMWRNIVAKQKQYEKIL